MTTKAEALRMLSGRRPFPVRWWMACVFRTQQLGLMLDRKTGGIYLVAVPLDGSVIERLAATQGDDP